MNAEMKWVVKGEVPSMKNELRIGRGGNFYHHGNAVKEYKASFAWQTPVAFKKKINVPVEVVFIVYQKDRRKDYHNAMPVIFDALQFSGVIMNDRLIENWTGMGRIDKEAPRVEISVRGLS